MPSQLSADILLCSDPKNPYAAGTRTKLHLDADFYLLRGRVGVAIWRAPHLPLGVVGAVHPSAPPLCSVRNRCEIQLPYPPPPLLAPVSSFFPG